MLHSMCNESKQSSRNRSAHSMGAPLANAPGVQRHPLAIMQSAYGNQAMLHLLGSSPSGAGTLRRKCECPHGRTDCPECKKKKEESGLRRSAAPGAGSVSRVPPFVHDVVSSPGRPLDAATRSFMEPRFGHDFSKVRIHTDAKAAESADAVNAHAYTVGRDIVFAQGRYSTGAQSRQLLAHELTHVVQQGSGESTAAQSIGPENDAYEHEAESVANHIAGANSAATLRRIESPGLVRRAAIHSGRILDEGTCADLVAGSKWICCDPEKGMKRSGKTTDIEGTVCPSQNFTPLFTCDHDCKGALANHCSDSANWMAIPKGRFKMNKCGQDLVICANGNFTHATVRDKSEREAWETSRAIPAALGVSPDFTGAIYGDESDPAFKKDKRCFPTPAKPTPAQTKEGGTSNSAPDAGGKAHE